MNIDSQRFKAREYLEPTKDFLEKEYELGFVKRGRQYFAYYPFHKENRRSFVLYCGAYEDNPAEVRLKCFGNCTLGKTDFDIYDFVQMKDKCMFLQAFQKVEKRDKSSLIHIIKLQVFQGFS